jgi:hypothetical protein
VGIIKLLERRYAKRLAQTRRAPDSIGTSAVLSTYPAPDQDNASPERLLPPDPAVASQGIQAPLASYMASSDLDTTMRTLGAVLPHLIRHQAQHSRRSEADIVYDVFDRVVEAIEVNWRRTQELRLEQACDEIAEVWVAAYPFLDHIRLQHGGMYETVRDNLCKGTRYVYFQPDRKYFDILRDMLTLDPAVKRANLSLCDNDLDSGLRFVEASSDLLKIVTFSIWNPQDSHRMEVVALPYHQNPIRIEEHDGVWQVLSKVTMLEVKDRAQAELLYEHLELLDKRAVEQFGQNKGRRNAGA